MIHLFQLLAVGEVFCAKFVYSFETEINVIYFRVKKINDGVTHAAKVFPNGYLSMILIGTIKGMLYSFPLDGLVFVQVFWMEYSHYIESCVLCKYLNRLMGGHRQ